MSILNNLNAKLSIYTSQMASSDEDIRRLIKFSRIQIPKDFLEVIREKSEIEILVDGKKYIRLWGADGCIEMNTAYKIGESRPDSLAIADDEGGNAMIYTTGQNGFGLYMIAFNNLDTDALQYVAGSLTDLLVNGTGIDEVINYV